MTKKSIHDRILHTIKEDIRNKKYEDKIPNERDLAVIYKVSRSTISKVLSQLVTEGLIFQKQGSGSYINTTFFDGLNDYSGYAFGPIGLSKTGKDGLSIESKVELLDVIKADSKTANRLQVEVDSFVYHVLRTRTSQDTIISLEELFIPIKTIPDLNSDYFVGSFYDYIEEHLKIKLKKSFYNISISKVGEVHAQFLNLPITEKVVKIDELVFKDDGQPFQISIVYMLTDHFSFNGISEL